jgi:hypothetical protein
LYKVLGLGKLGCAIAEEFTAYPEYRVYKIDADTNERASLSIGKYSNMQEYEKNLQKDEVEIYLRSIKEGDEVLFVVEGGDPISGASLSILETIRFAKISVMYVVPDRELCSLVQKRDDRICFYVMQEYARSGLFDNLFLLEKASVENLIGDVSIQEHEKQMAYFIAYVFAMLNFFKHTASVLSGEISRNDISRLSTLGICSLEDDTSMLFPLEGIKDTMFFYGIPERDLDEDQSLMRKIKSHVKDRNPGESAGFSIYSTTLDKPFIVGMYSSAQVQKLPKEF